jgi:hypothetical protein
MRSFLYFFVISAINSGPSRASVEPCDYPFRSPSPACWVCLKIDTPHSIHALPSSFSHEMCQKLGFSPGFFYHQLRVFPNYPRERHAINWGAPWTKMKLAGFSLLTSLWSSPKTSTLSPVDAGKRKNGWVLGHIRNTSNCLCFQRISEYECYFFMYFMVLLQEVTCFYHILRSIGPVSPVSES